MVATPTKNNDLRRRTLLQQTEALETSFFNRTSFIETPPVHNDERERITRRQSKGFLSQSPNESSKFLGEPEMKDHFQICTKLFSENKITTKNAWQLHIIDLLRHMSQKPNQDTLQVASASLDISAKVYGIRVDDIHADGLKLASNMARATEKQTPQNDDLDEAGENVENNDEAGLAKKKKKKKKRLTPGEKRTICKAPRCALPKLESVFFSTRTNVETNPIDNLFTNMLPMDKSGFKFMLLSQENAWPSGPDPLVSQNTAKKIPVAINPVNDFKICHPFNDMVIDEWDQEKEEQMDNDKLLLRQNEVIYDDDGIPIPEMDGSIKDIFSNDLGDDNYDSMDEDGQEDVFMAQIHGEIAHIVDFTPNDVSKRTEYSYNTTLSTNGRVMDQIWAGPSHWKLKYIRRTTAKFSGQLPSLGKSEKVSKQAKKKVCEPFDFHVDRDFTLDMSKVLKTKKKKHRESQKFTLPVPDPSCMNMAENTNKLELRPRAAAIKKLPQDIDFRAQEEVEIDTHDDSMTHNQDDGVQDYDDYEPVDLFAEAQQNFDGGNLVDAPELVPKSYVPYALQAKKMDMKKLKTAVWQNLTSNVSKEIVMVDAHKREGRVSPTSFSKLYQDVPKLLPEKMKNELSCPLVFVALLHLCNEQNLELRAHGNNKDFEILG